MYKADRLSRVKTRQREFCTRRVAKEVMEDVLGMVMIYRPVQEAKEMLKWVLEDVGEQSWINTMFREVTDTGPSAVSKLELKICNRQVVVHMVEDLKEEAMDMVHKRERKSLQEKKRLE